MIDFTQLGSGARKILETFMGIFPAATPTSGKRDISEQASAMAANVLKNPTWIRETYLSSPVSVACQAWVDENGIQGDVAAGLYGVLASFDPDELRRLSWHLSGDAFDIQPVGGDLGSEMTDWLQRLIAKHIVDGGQAKLLTKEGGLTRWHVQASPLPESYVPPEAA